MRRSQNGQSSARRFRSLALRVVAVVALIAGGTAVSADAAFGAAAITVSPTTGLLDRQALTVNGSGWIPGHAINLGECNLAAFECEQIGTTYANGQGEFLTFVAANRFVGITDCADPAATCALFAGDVADIPGTAVHVDIDFLPVVPVVLPGVGYAKEGNTGTTSLVVPLRLSHPFFQTVTVEWRTASTAAPPPPQADPATDFTATSGVATFSPGITTATVLILVHGDRLVEPGEWVVVSFHDPTNARIGGYWGLGFGGIVNDD